MEDGTKIEIADEDVHNALGIPIGGEEIKTYDKSDNFDVIEEWASHFAPRHYTTLGKRDIAIKMKDYVNADAFFIRCFMVPFVSLLCESQPNGKVNVSFLRSLKDVDNIPKMNWCGFLRRCLVDAKMSWDTGAKSYFKGPMAFFTLFYVDRTFLFGNKNVPTFPGFTRWDSKLLKERESIEMRRGSFVLGSVQERPVILPIKEDAPENLDSVNATVSEHQKSKKKEWLDGLSHNIHQLVSIIGDLAELTENIPDEVKSDREAMLKHQTAIHLIGAGNLEAIQNDQITSSQLEPIWSQSQHPFWQDPALHKWITEVEEAYSKKKILKNHAISFPSFDLGIEGLDEVYNNEPLPNVNDQNNEDVLNPQSEIGEDQQPPIAQDEEQLHDISIPMREEGMPSNSKGHTEQLVQPSLFQEEMDNLNLLDAVTPVVAKCIESAFSSPMENAFRIGARVQPARKKNPSHLLLSPYFDREVDPNADETVEEYKLCEFLKAEDVPKTEVMFKYQHIELRFEDFQSLQNGQLLEMNIVDAWANILNHKEQRKSTDSPLRLFGTCYSSLNTIVHPQYKEEDDNYPRFEEAFDKVLQLALHIRLEEVDLIIFPIISSVHFYLVCFDFKRAKIEVGDNLDTAVSFKNKYGEIPNVLARMLSKFLETHGLIAKAKSILKIVPEKLKLDWMVKKNHIDCGVYAMRHMELYKGKGGRAFQCGFKKNRAKRTIEALRQRYLGAIFQFEDNEVRDSVYQRICNHHKKNAKPLDYINRMKSRKK